LSVTAHLAEKSWARQDIAAGKLGYRLVGEALCVFFGPTA
jgi:hypothetical protein